MYVTVARMPNEKPKGRKYGSNLINFVGKPLPVVSLIYRLGAILLIIDISLFTILYFVSADNNTKLLIIAIYSIVTLPLLYLGFFWYYKRNEFDKTDLTSLRNIPNYRLYSRIFVYVIPIIFTLFIINYVVVSVNNESPAYIIGALKIPELTDFVNKTIDFISDPSNAIPGINSHSFGVFMLVILGQYGYLAAIPNSAAREFKFYLAEDYFVKAMNVKPGIGMEIEKINLFTKGLDSYDEYIRKALKHKINKNKIFSKVAADSTFSSDEKIQELTKAFQNSDKLSPLKQMSRLFEDSIADELVVRVSKFDLLKESSELTISIITTVITVITTFFIKPL